MELLLRHGRYGAPAVGVSSSKFVRPCNWLSALQRRSIRTIWLKVAFPVTMMLRMFFGAGSPSLRQNAMIRIREVEAAVIFDQKIEEYRNEDRAGQGVGFESM